MAIKKKAKRTLRIGIADSRMIKAGRDRISGIMRYAATHDDWEVRILSVGTPHTISANETLDYRRLDGLLGNSRMISRIAETLPRTIPIVLLDSSRDTPQNGKAISRVFVDNAAIGAAAAEIFLKGGLRNLAFVGMQSQFEHQIQNERLAAFRQAACSTGASCDAFLPKPSINEKDDIAELAAWLAHLPHPCGVMAYSDNRAQTVLDACRMAHLRVPDQIQLVGVDNEIEICENMQPTLTSILPDFEGGGFLAAHLLDDILSHSLRPRKPFLHTYGIKTVVVRASTQDLKGGGRLVTLAREFIRLHAGERISVTDVARALNVSRRTIENRFKDVLDRGVADVLREERLTRVCRLLRETDRTITDIAYDSGFASPTHLKAAFKRFTGMTMGGWRAREGQVLANRSM